MKQRDFTAMNRRSNLLGAMMLLLTAFIWGTTFVAQSDAMSNIGPFMFQTIRTVIGGVFLTVLYFGSQGKRATVPFRKENIRLTLTGGIVCGVILFASVNMQQIGLIGSAPGKAAFITSLYILIVPILGVFVGKKVGPVVWVCAVISLIGFYFLNITPDIGFGLSGWDIAVLICAVTFSFHIVAVEKYGPQINAILLSCIQFWTVAVLSACCIFMDFTVFGYSMPDASVFGAVWFNLLYAGLFSSGIAYTLQIAGQKRMQAAAASLLMSLESVFAAISAWIFDPKNAMDAVQIGGCTLIFAAICISQIPFKSGKYGKTQPPAEKT